MTNNEARGNKKNPTDRSTAARTGEDSDAPTEQSFSEKTRGRTGDGPSSGSPSSFSTEYTRDTLWPTAKCVLEYLRDHVDDVSYIKAYELVEDLDEAHTTQEVGTALGALANTTDIEIDVDNWSQSKNGVTWRIEPARKVATDGGRTQLKFAPEPRQTLRVAADNGGLAATVRYSHERPIVQAGERLDLVAAETGDVIGEARVARTVETPVYRALDYINNHCAAYSTRRIGRLIANLNEYYKAKIGPETDVVVIFLNQVDLDATADKPEPMTDGGRDLPDHITVFESFSGEVARCKRCGADADSLEELEHTDGCPKAGEELVTDGGTQFYIVDEERRAIVDGPFLSREAAQDTTVAQEPSNIVVGKRALELAKSERPIRDERGDVDIVTDGGQSQGAIDNEFEDAERDAYDVLVEHMADIDAPGHHDMSAGDVAIDLVTRQPLFIVERVAHDLAEFYENEEFDLATYKQHAWLPVTIDDAVYRCVFIGGLDDLHSFSNVYDYPAGRLARVPIELATGGDE